MTVLAGTLRASGTANSEWVACNRAPYYVLYNPAGAFPRPHTGTGGYGDRRDYVRRVGRKYGFTGLGPMGFMYWVPGPASGGSFVKTCDDSSDT